MSLLMLALCWVPPLAHGVWLLEQHCIMANQAYTVTITFDDAGQVRRERWVKR